MTKELIHKYFEGNCSPEEALEMSVYLKGEDLSLLHEYMDEVDQANNDEDSISAEQSDHLLHAIHGKINTEEVIRYIEHEVETDGLAKPENNEGGKEILKPKRKLIHMLPVRIAASIALVLTLGASAYFFWNNNSAKQQDQQVAGLWTTISNPTTNVKKVQMVDGTNIWLNAYSSFSFNKAAYNLKNREVHIIGEAYFDVSHNPRKPFIVRAGKLSTIVLGTAFNVEAYRNEKSIRVILVRGKVRVEAGENKRIMKPGQMLRYSLNTNQLAMHEVETSEVNAWVTGKLVFNGIPLADALGRIAQLYHIDIKVSKRVRIENKRLTGVFERKAPDDVLKKVLFVYGLNYRKKGGEYIISR